jgi:hypothetical protein
VAPADLTGKSPSHLSRCKSYQEWSKPQSGLKAVIMRAVPTVNSSSIREINDKLTPGSPAHQLATLALSTSVMWINAFVVWVDDNYQTMLLQSKFTASQAWSVTTQLIARIFGDMYLVRQGLEGGIDTGSPLSCCTTVLWSVLRTHDVMAEYLAKDFGNHPSISSELVRFLATNSGNEKVEELEDQVAKLTIAVAETKRAATEAGKKSDAAGNALDGAKKTIEALSKRVAALERK